MDNCKKYLAGVDTPEIKLFRENFNTYRKALDKEMVDALMKNYPGEEWHIILIKRSGLNLPSSIKEYIIQYDKDKQIKEEKINKIASFLEDPDSKEIGNMYVKFKKWHYKYFCEGTDITMDEFKELSN